MAGINPRNVNQDGSNASQGQSVGRTGKGWGMTMLSNRREGPWEPTVTYLLLLVILEFAAYAVLRYTFRSVHGG